MRWFLVPVAFCLACSGGEPVEQEPGVLDPTVNGRSPIEVLEEQRFELGPRGSFSSRISVRVHLPERAVDALPVLILNHDASVATRQYTALANRLATWGFVVLVPTWDPPATGLSGQRTHQGLSDDLVALMDALQSDPLDLNYELFTDRIGLIGHARGAKQVVHAAARSDHAGPLFLIGPTDATPRGQEGDDWPSVIPDRAASVNQPTAIFDLPLAYDAVDGGSACIPEALGTEAFFETLGGRSVRYTVVDGGLNEVLDDCASGRGGSDCQRCLEGDRPAFTRSAASTIAAGFFLQTLAANPDAAGWVEGTIWREFFEDDDLDVLARQ